MAERERRVEQSPERNRKVFALAEVIRAHDTGGSLSVGPLTQEVSLTGRTLANGADPDMFVRIPEGAQEMRLRLDGRGMKEDTQFCITEDGQAYLKCTQDSGLPLTAHDYRRIMVMAQDYGFDVITPENHHTEFDMPFPHGLVGSLPIKVSEGESFITTWMGAWDRKENSMRIRYDTNGDLVDVTAKNSTRYKDQRYNAEYFKSAVWFFPKGQKRVQTYEENRLTPEAEAEADENTAMLRFMFSIDWLKLKKSIADEEFITYPEKERHGISILRNRAIQVLGTKYDQMTEDPHAFPAQEFDTGRRGLVEIYYDEGEGMSTSEIADVLGVDEQTVRQDLMAIWNADEQDVTQAEPLVKRAERDNPEYHNRKKGK